MLTNNNQQKILGLWNIVIMTVVANFGIRWLAVAAGMGPESIFFWCVGALLFFLPLALVTANLSRAYPEEGGLYAWVKLALGEKPAFIVAWLYWVNSIFYYPAVMIFLATNFAYAVGKPELANNHVFITSCVLIAFWLIVLASIFGLKASKYLVSIGGILGTVIPVFLIIILSIVSLFVTKHSATNFNAHQWVPTHGIFNNLAVLTIIMFAMAGVEVISTFANAVKNPKRDLYFGLLVACVAIFLFYTLGTLALNVILKPSEINSTAGLVQAFSVVDIKFGMPWLTRIMAFLLTFADLAAVTVWLLAPIIMFFKCTPRGVLPDWLHKTNRFLAPSNALLFMGVLVSLVMLLTNFVPSINDMYQVLVLMATILYFIPYLFLAVAYVKLYAKRARNKAVVYLISISVLFSVSLGIAFSFPPPSSLTTTHEIIFYEFELILGPLLFIALGLLLARKIITK